ncbi:MAG: ATP-binding protein [Candidatus Omnitrophota bacterium]
MNRFVYFFFGVVLIGVLVALLWAAKTHEEAVQSLPDILARDFQPFLAGKDVTEIDTGRIERRVVELKAQYPYINRIIIRKIAPNGGEITLYPWAFDIDHPDWPPLDAENYAAKSIVGDNYEPLGILYIRIDARRGRLFKIAIGGSMIALVLVVGLGLYTISAKDEAVRKTTYLLEEKQRELIHLERLALVGQVTANLLHDLKKPVLNIRAEAELLPPGESKKTILDETELFLSLLRELHLEGFLRKDRERAEFLDVGDVMERSLRLVKYAQENVKVSMDLPENLPFLFGQRHQLIQVFSNILLNAFQALEGEGSIRIAASPMEEEGEKRMEISLTDDGPGMPYEVLTHIFEPFYSTRGSDESTGLGLYISKSIVEGMGGRIDAKSIPKHGTTFTLQFPISDAEAESASEGKNDE